MTIFPELEDKNVEYALSTAASVLHTTRERRAGSVGEEQAQHIYSAELSRYCDDVYIQNFKSHPGAGTLAEKLLCALLVFCVFLFSAAVSGGYVAHASISLVISLICFCAFMYKFVFDGKKLDFITKTKSSKNILGVRRSRDKTEKRVVLVACTDSPQSLRMPVFGYKTPLIFSLLSILGNSVLFASSMLFLFCSAPEGSPFFIFLKWLCFLFVPVYVFSLFLINKSSVTSGLSTSVIPCSILLGIMKQFHENSHRFDKTEVCCLITGSEHSSRAGAYAFSQKYKRLYKDVPTVFIPLEEITVSNKLCVFCNDGSGTKGSKTVRNTIFEAADNLKIKIQKESVLFGSGAFTPFSKAGFSACSIGTSKKHISKTLTATGDGLSSVSPKAISDTGALVIETLNYYDG